MSIVDLHPEELFDKMVQGRLSAAEGARLMAHLATCPACRFELDVRRDFARTVRELPFGVPVGAPSGGPPPLISEFRALGGRPRRRRAVWLLSLAAALIASASVAALAPGVGGFVVRYLPKTFVAVAPGVQSPSTRPPPKTTTREVASPPQPQITEAPAAVAEAPTKLEDLPIAAPPAHTDAHASASSLSASPAELFRQANGARRAGDDRTAMALYRALEQKYPNSAEARLSHATLGRLMLDRGDAELALEDFDRYLSEGGTALGEEALVGRALALGKLGARDAEASAWKEVLRRFPKSIHARLARTRLSALGEP